MNILIINTVPTEQNGITGVIFNYLNAIDARGIIFDLLSLNTPSKQYIEAIESKGGHVFVLSRLNAVFAYWNGLRKLIKERHYDAVHIHGNSHTVALELSAAKVAGCAVRIVHSHTTMCKHMTVSWLLTMPFKMLYTHGMACSMAAGRWMFGKRIFTVMNNGVNTDLYVFNPDKRKRIREKYGWQNCRVIGHVGGMVETKNHKFMLDIFDKLHKRDSCYRLLLIGDGPLRTEIETQIERLGLKEFVLLTGCTNNVCDYLNAIDMILMPSLFEGLPLTLIEQQANGLRCIVSDTITKEADMTGNLSFLSLSMTASQWADKISSLPTENEHERIQISRKAVSDITASGYNIKEEAKKLKDYYINAIKK